MTHRLSVHLPDSLHDALVVGAGERGVSVAHLVRELLSDGVDVDHHSLFQVSTSGAVVEGVYQGCVSVGSLRSHGDFGIGTFDRLDGELVMVDGHCFQARGDGLVSEAPDDASTPFAVVTRFLTDREVSCSPVSHLVELTAQLDVARPTDNLFAGVRVRAAFDRIDLRAACRTESGVPLVEATADQSTWSVSSVTGTLVGFWSPSYSRSVAIPGYHFHFVSDDRTQAGHVLDLAVGPVVAELHEVADIHLALPETEEFVRADLSGDPTSALQVAENPRES